MNRTRSDATAFRPVWLRLILSFVAAFLAAGHLATISHMAFVAHARCAEHGALVHVDAGRGADRAGEASTAPSARSGGALADEHDHCALGTAQPAEARVGPPACRLVPGEDPPAAAPLAPPRFARALVAPPPPIALLLLSPKSSPPA